MEGQIQGIDDNPKRLGLAPTSHRNTRDPILLLPDLTAHPTQSKITMFLSTLILVPDLDRQLLKRARPTPLDALERTDQDLFDARPTGMNFVLDARRALRSHNLVFRKQPFRPVSSRRSLRCRWIQAPLCQRRTPRQRTDLKTVSGVTVQHAGDRMDDAPRHKNFLLKLVQKRISLGTDRRSLDLEEPMILPADGLDRAGDKTLEVARLSRQRSKILRCSQAQCQRRS